MARRIELAILAIVGVSAFIGCGSGNNGGLRGTVTYNGTPVEKGSISFVPADRAAAPFGAQIHGGSYAAEKTYQGQYTAIVVGDRYTKPLTREQAAAALPANYIPEKSEGNSKQVDVSGEDQTLDFAITGPPQG